jgi:predicted MFS family arabinose efflux permease
MNDLISSERRIISPADANWGAVWSLSLTVICLVTAELLPISLLTPMALDLGVTDGMAGQAVSATSIVAMVASLFMAVAMRGLDRRIVLLFFTAFFIASNMLVGIASDYSMLLIGRVLLGVAIGGFWSMSAAVSMRLVPEALAPRALSIIFGGVSVAMVIAAPVGSFLGGVIGWRGVFLLTAAVGIVVLVWQFAMLPSMLPRGQPRVKTLVRLLARPQIGFGVLAMILVFGGHFAFFTYLRPFLETVTGTDVGGVSVVLFGFGIANVIGTFLSGAMIQRSLRMTLAIMPLIMAILSICLVAFGNFALIVVVLVAVWGLAFGAVPVAWMTWVTQKVPDETESAGGLQVAAIQLSITIGAGLGGLLLETSGPRGAIIGGGMALLLASAVILVGLRPPKMA